MQSIDSSRFQFRHICCGLAHYSRVPMGGRKIVLAKTQNDKIDSHFELFEIRNLANYFIFHCALLASVQMIGVNSSAINRCSIIKYWYIEFSTIIIRSSIIKIITANFMNSTVNRCVAPSRRFDSSMFLLCLLVCCLFLSFSLFLSFFQQFWFDFCSIFLAHNKSLQQI